MIVSRVAHEATLEESDVEDGRVEVDELENEHFEGQVVLEVRLCPMHFCEGGRYVYCGMFSLTWRGSKTVFLLHHNYYGQANPFSFLSLFLTSFKFISSCFSLPFIGLV